MSKADNYTMGEFFRDFRAAQQAAAAERRERAMKALTDAGASFTVHNHGAHLRVRVGDRAVDYWPGTCCFGDGNKTRRIGLDELLRLVAREVTP